MLGWAVPELPTHWYRGSRSPRPELAALQEPHANFGNTFSFGEGETVPDLPAWNKELKFLLGVGP